MNVSQFPKQELLDRLRNITQRKQNEIEWPNVVVTTSTKKYEKFVSESSFTLFSNRKGTVDLKTDKRNLKICEQTFYVSNPFERFSYEIDSKEKIETFNIHLNYDFYTKAKYGFLNSDDKILDNPFGTDTAFQFTNQLHFRTVDFNELLQSYEEKEEDVFLSDILQHCLLTDLKEKRKSLQLSVTKKSTKEELTKRMIIAKDYLFSNYSDPEFSVSSLSERVAMSHFHFLRTFKKMYGISPYQYLKGIRLEKAKYLIRKTKKSINEIACDVGYQEPSALYPILKRDLKKTPLEYRMEISNFQ